MLGCFSKSMAHKPREVIPKRITLFCLAVVENCFGGGWWVVVVSANTEKHTDKLEEIQWRTTSVVVMLEPMKNEEWCGQPVFFSLEPNCSVQLSEE